VESNCGRAGGSSQEPYFRKQLVLLTSSTFQELSSRAVRRPGSPDRASFAGWGGGEAEDERGICIRPADCRPQAARTVASSSRFAPDDKSDGYSLGRFRSRNRCTFPVAVLGNSVTNCTQRGYL